MAHHKKMKIDMLACCKINIKGSQNRLMMGPCQSIQNPAICCQNSKFVMSNSFLYNKKQHNMDFYSSGYLNDDEIIDDNLEFCATW